jgi:hypothetical protein
LTTVTTGSFFANIEIGLSLGITCSVGIFLGIVKLIPPIGRRTLDKIRTAARTIAITPKVGC